MILSVWKWIKSSIGIEGSNLILTLCLVVATGIQGWQAIVANRSAANSAHVAETAANAAEEIAHATQRQADIIMSSLTTTQRAYDTADLPLSFTLSSPSTIVLFTYNNTGSTSAKAVHLLVGYRIISPGDGTRITIADCKPLNDGSDSHDQIAHSLPETAKQSIQLSREDIRQLAGGQILLVFGSVEYDDVFNTHHATHYCNEFTSADRKTAKAFVECQSFHEAT